MPQDPNLYFAMAAFGVVSIAIVATFGLRGWRDWIALKKDELAMMQPTVADGVPSAASRIEVADLKERVKKLEAIAAGIDL